MSCVSLTTPLQRFRNEVHVGSLLNRNVDVVPLVGVYSTEAHPFGLVYEYMESFDLRHYLKNEHNVGTLKLVLVSLPDRCLSFGPLTILANS